MARKEVLNPAAVHKPTGYSHAVRKGNTLYLAGQVPLDSQGRLVGPGDIQAQTEQVIANIKAVVEAAGGGLDDIVKMTVFTTNMAYRPVIAEVRSRYFGADSLPASTLVMIPSLAQPEFLVEIETVAELD
ncbi:MAG: RidA family protein [Dehalococcoidia bacterium]